MDTVINGIDAFPVSSEIGYMSTSLLAPEFHQIGRYQLTEPELLKSKLARIQGEWWNDVRFPEPNSIRLIESKLDMWRFMCSGVESSLSARYFESSFPATYPETSFSAPYYQASSVSPTYAETSFPATYYQASSVSPTYAETSFPATYYQASSVTATYPENSFPATYFVSVTAETLEEWRHWWRLDIFRVSRFQETESLLRQSSRLLAQAVRLLLQKLSCPPFPFQLIRREEAWSLLHGSHPPKVMQGHEDLHPRNLGRACRLPVC
jgi:hypothetical protein